MSRHLKILMILLSVALLLAVALPVGGQGNVGDVTLSLRLPGDLWNASSGRDAPVLVSTGRVIGGWPFGGNGEHGGYAGYLYVKNNTANALTNLTVNLEVSEPLQIAQYDAANAYHRPTGKTSQEFKVSDIAAGATKNIKFSVAVPPVTSSSVSSGGQRSMIKAAVADSSGKSLATLSAVRPLVPLPYFLFELSLLCTVALFVLLFVWGRRGDLFLAPFTARDWAYVVVFGIVIGAVWHLWIGQTLGFASFARNLTPQPFVNQAITDIGWYTLFALGVLMVRKPGAATIIAVFHEYFYGFGFGSVIPFGTGWYLRPFVVGIFVDLFLALLYKRNPALRSEKGFSLAGAVSAAVIGLMPFWWTLVMHIVYHPSIANMYVDWSYMIPEAVTRGLGGVIYAVVLAYPLSIFLRRVLPESVAPEPSPAPAPA